MPLGLKNSLQIPLRHISIRVPWHDNEWNGCICNRPQENSACLVLPRIREVRNDVQENDSAGVSLSELQQESWPACATERGSFMAPFPLTRQVIHPYAKNSKSENSTHGHILPTELKNPPYSAAAIPFRWMNKKSAWDIGVNYNINLDPEKEPREPKWLAKRPWVQHHENQKALLEKFFSAIRPQESLCFFYSKQVPFIEDERRVLIGVGRVVNTGRPVEYNYSEKRDTRAYLWDVIVQHSIRPEFKDGFLLPYNSILKLAEGDSSIDPSEFVAFAPDDRREEFSFAAEHVTHDAAIASLLACKRVLEKARPLVKEPCHRALKWIDDRLSELWKLRGPYPGLGSALTAFGIQHGNFVAYALASKLEDNEDPWPLIDQIFSDPTLLPEGLSREITAPLKSTWEYLKEKKPCRLDLLKLLSRMELTNQQAKRFYIEEIRSQAGISCEDSDILENPYLIYELDRFANYDPDGDWPKSISPWTVDRGLFPSSVIQEKYPLPKPSLMEGATDSRRVRALIVALLEKAANEGHSLLPRKELIRFIRELDLEPECPINGDLLEAISESLNPIIQTCKMADGTPAYQLDRLAIMGKIIRDTVAKRVHGRTIETKVDWHKKLDEKLKKKLEGYDPSDEDEQRALEEKAAALKELAGSRISVLIGPAGTGKTLLLSVLCDEPSIQSAGIVLLAPTGKARVRLQQSTKLRAKTLAQFLLDLKRYDPITSSFHLSNSSKKDTSKTVIVDEASMLTEEQLAALIDSLKSFDRLILVGDPHQLPPIGTGRPFVDIVTYLTPENIESVFPRVSRGYAELTIRRRQIEKKKEEREDTQLAEWFSGRPIGPGDDEILSRIIAEEKVGRVRFISWKDAEDLQNTLLQVLAEELHLQAQDDSEGFELSLGGNLGKDGFVYFNKGAGKKAENWQVLTPFRVSSCGSSELNRMIQKHFRAATIKLANSYRGKIPKPMGNEEIVYGDKIINVINNHRDYVFPKKEALNYVANGEIGIVTGQFRQRDATWRPWLLKIEFSSQPGFVYDYSPGDFNEEYLSILELAYAITIHKAQGSEFGLSIVILPQPCRLLSRELLYTALTRQKDRVVIMHQGDRAEIKKYSSDSYSDTARRLTNLFRPPSLVEVTEFETRFLEERLIHRSGKGEPMRSKSEVIIADSLAEAGIEYAYEKPLKGNDGNIRYPDFTIEDDDSGITYYWEHCGMLYDTAYRRRWEAKLVWLQEQGVLPKEEGYGQRGTLIVTSDTLAGGISSQEIKKLIKEIWDK